MAIQIVSEPITLDELRLLAQRQFGDFVKAVVDARPSQGNRSRSVEDPAIRQQIVNVVTGLISA